MKMTTGFVELKLASKQFQIRFEFGIGSRNFLGAIFGVLQTYPT